MTLTVYASIRVLLAVRGEEGWLESTETFVTFIPVALQLLMYTGSPFTQRKPRMASQASHSE